MAANNNNNLHVQAADPSHISILSSLWAEPNGLLPATIGRILPARLTEHLVQAARITFGNEQQDFAQIRGIFLVYIEEEEELLLVAARLEQRQREKDEEILRLWQEEQEQRSRNRGAGTEEQEQRSRNRGAGTEEQEQRSRNRGAGTEEQEQRQVQEQEQG
ncbi:hypothetical protein Ct61P_15494 [Colletotrichum tofieldiae]|nr:hypothetical protein Ct61P_15494 [Colletotrichum tofieldiae]